MLLKGENRSVDMILYQREVKQTDGKEVTTYKSGQYQHCVRLKLETKSRDNKK